MSCSAAAGRSGLQSYDARGPIAASVPVSRLVGVSCPLADVRMLASPITYSTLDAHCIIALDSVASSASTLPAPRLVRMYGSEFLWKCIGSSSNRVCLCPSSCFPLTRAEHVFAFRINNRQWGCAQAHAKTCNCFADTSEYQKDNADRP